MSAWTVVNLLNEAARLDPVAMRILVSTRVACNDSLLDHPTIQAGRDALKNGEVGLLGILNGIFGTFDDGYGCIEAIVDDDKPIRFQVGSGSKKR